ncbi:MAG TPA: hypothetical protein VG248_17060 [Caulobacteraceae bacterium]|jgi:hypothetical protein|nr:hypothetical protein [Caulobacteraceae bacterium]
MSVKLDPLVSEFDTEEDAKAYDAWFRAKVEVALDGGKPRIPHDKAMAQVEARLAQRRSARGRSKMD